MAAAAACKTGGCAFCKSALVAAVLAAGLAGLAYNYHHVEPAVMVGAPLKTNLQVQDMLSMRLSTCTHLSLCTAPRIDIARVLVLQTENTQPLDEPTDERSSVTFPCNGDVCEAWLYQPKTGAGRQQAPCCDHGTWHGRPEGGQSWPQ